METGQMIDLALNARLGHWPPHLGLTTDAEKIEYLAVELDKAATQIVNADLLADENEALREERDDLASQCDDLTAKLRRINELSNVSSEA